MFNTGKSSEKQGIETTRTFRKGRMGYWMLTGGLWREPVYSGICYYDTGVRDLSQPYGTVRVPCCVPFVLVCVPFSCLPGRTVLPSSPLSVRLVQGLVPPFRLSRFSFPHLFVYIFRRKLLRVPNQHCTYPSDLSGTNLKYQCFPTHLE